MARTLKGLTRALLNDLVRLGLEEFAAGGASLPAIPDLDPAWTPVATIADEGVTGFIAHVDRVGGGYYVIMLTVDDGDSEPGSRAVTIAGLLEHLNEPTRRALTPAAP